MFLEMNWRRNGSRRAGPASVTTRQIITDIATTNGTALLIASLIGPLFRTDCTTQRLRPNVDMEQKGICRALPTVLRRYGGHGLDPDICRSGAVLLGRKAWGFSLADASDVEGSIAGKSREQTRDAYQAGAVAISCNSLAWQGPD